MQEKEAGYNPTGENPQEPNPASVVFEVQKAHRDLDPPDFSYGRYFFFFLGRRFLAGSSKRIRLGTVMGVSASWIPFSRLARNSVFASTIVATSCRFFSREAIFFSREATLCLTIRDIFHSSCDFNSLGFPSSCRNCWGFFLRLIAFSFRITSSVLLRARSRILIFS
jgi:hypothetical protein